MLLCPWGLRAAEGDSPISVASCHKDWDSPPVFGYRFFSVMLIPQLSIMMNDVSKSGFFVIASM